MQLNLLGPIELLDGDGAAVALGGPTPRAVLALLALAGGRTVSVDALLEGAWSGEGPGSGAKALQSVVSRLRAALAKAGDAAIDASGAGYALRLPAGALDVDRLQQVAPGDALALWRGPALDEFAGLHAFEAERRRLAELRWRLVEEHADAELAAGRYSRIIEDLELHVAAAPLRARLWSQLLTALARAGRQADALRAFQRARDAFADAGLDPPADLVALEQAIASGGGVAAAAPPAATLAATFDGDAAFLFTDVVGSTTRWDDDPAGMAAALATHDAAIEAAVTAHRGRLLKAKGEGDSTVSVFTSAAAALRAAADAQRSLALPVRMAVHAGPVEGRDDDFFGPTMNRAARLRAVAHGGQIVCSEAAAALAGPALGQGDVLVDLGVHRLRDLSKPERIFQLVTDGLSAEFPPLASLSRRNSNLPAQATTFVGREIELDRVRELLDASRLVTLTGAGGSGKTRLAMQAAADALDEFGDGVWLAELAPLSDPGLVPNALAEALPGAGAAGQDVTAAVVASLADKHALVVIDNCEHVIDAAAALASRLLAECPHVKILATSRERLRVNGEAAWPVPVLTLPSSEQDAAGSEAVRLFCDRAVDADPAFTLDATNTAAVIEVCRRVDGIPLAIELAAARVRALPPEELARRLTAHRDVLTRGDRNALPRHRSLRATIDWSHSLLADAERLVLRRLAVFRGGWALRSAEEVASGGDISELDVVDALEALVDKSLVAVERDSGRYSMLETVREFGLEQLTGAGEQDELRARHAHDVGRIAAELGERVQIGQHQLDALAEARREHDNITAALAWAMEHDPVLAARIIGDLGVVWSVIDTRAQFLSAYRWLADSSGVTATDAPRGFIVAGTMLAYAGDADAALELVKQAVAVAKAGDDVDVAALGLVLIGSALRIYDRLDEARAFVEEALGLVAQGTRPFVRDWVKIWGSWLMADLDEPNVAYRLIVEGYEAARADGNFICLNAALGMMGYAAPGYLDPDEELRQAREVSHQLLGMDDLPTPLEVYDLLEAGDIEAAIPLIEDDLSRPQPHYRFALRRSEDLALCYHAVGRFDDALRQLAPLVEPGRDLPLVERYLFLTDAVFIRRDVGDTAGARAALDTVLEWLASGEAPQHGWSVFDPTLWTGFVLMLTATIELAERGAEVGARAAGLIAAGTALTDRMQLFGWRHEYDHILNDVLPTLPAPPAAVAGAEGSMTQADALAYARGDAK